LTFGLGIIILQGVSRRKSLAGVNIMTFYGFTLCVGSFALTLTQGTSFGVKHVNRYRHVSKCDVHPKIASSNHANGSFMIKI
jgi:hypothetical protein